MLARIPREELRSLLEGYGCAPRFVEGSDPDEMHQRMAGIMDEVVEEIAAIQAAARRDGVTDRPRWPMIVLRGVHPHRRLDVQPARQVVEGHPRDLLGAAGRFAELPAVLARVAPGPQRLLPPGSRFHRPCRQQAGSGDGDIGTPGAQVRTLVIAAREDLQIAREVRRLLGGDRMPVDR